MWQSIINCLAKHGRHKHHPTPDIARFLFRPTKKMKKSKQNQVVPNPGNFSVFLGYFPEISRFPGFQFFDVFLKKLTPQIKTELSSGKNIQVEFWTWGILKLRWLPRIYAPLFACCHATELLISADPQRLPLGLPSQIDPAVAGNVR